MNTPTRASFANADQCHASTAKTPLLRPNGLVMPQVTPAPDYDAAARAFRLMAEMAAAPPDEPLDELTTSQTIPSQWEANPDLHCQAIAAEYQWAIEHIEAQVPITPQLCTDARNWLQAELSKITSLGFWPLFTDAESSLSEALAAFNQPHSPNALVQIPITNQHNDPHPVWSPLENLLFRFVHDYHHWVTAADATFNGELAVTRHVLTPAVRHNDSLARFLASEIIGQAAVTITSGSYPVQIIAQNILELI